MAITHDGPRSGTPVAQHRRHLRLVPRSSVPTSSLSSSASSSSGTPSESHLPQHDSGATAMEISFAAELLGAAPAEISSLTELRARLSATYGAASDAALASWIDRLPNPKYLDASPENVQSNVVEILREIAREASISSNVKEIALHYLREHRRNSLELLSSKV